MKGAKSIARIAAENGVENFIQLSHLNANPDSASKFYATKFEGVPGPQSTEYNVP